MNELGRELFSHTSAIYVDVAGKSVFDVNAAQEFLAEMQADREAIRKNGAFEGEQALARVLDVYRDGIATLQQRIEDNQ